MLIHIGYHKTASTWLQKVLFHKENAFEQPIHMNELYSLIVKPSPFYFDKHAVRSKFNIFCNANKHTNLCPVLSHECFCGNPFTGARDAKMIADRLYESFPDAKILVVIREQVSLIIALYKTYVLQGGAASLRDFLYPPENEVNQWFSKDSYLFDKLIEYYLNLYGKDHVLILPYEFLKHDNHLFYHQLCEFMNIKKQDLNTKAQMNVGLCNISIEMLRYWNKLFSSFSAYPLNLSSNTIWRFIRSLIYKINPMLKKIPCRNTLQKETRKYCQGVYENSNQLTQSYVNFDLSAFGYTLNGTKGDHE